MNLTVVQRRALDHLREAYVGPEGSDDEVLYNRPSLQYSVGMLFPSESSGNETPGADDLDALSSAVNQGDVEEGGAGVPLAEDWRPSSMAISFVTESKQVLCDFSGGTYSALADDGPPRWQRHPFTFDQVIVAPDQPPRELRAGVVPVEIGSRWRRFGDAYLVTVHARVLTESTGDDKLDIELMLFQAGLQLRAGEGGEFKEYSRAESYDIDEESAELRLRYRNRKVYAVGHGMAADWSLDSDRCSVVFLSPVPAYVVPRVETTGFEPDSDEARALDIETLSHIDTDPEGVISSLDTFVTVYSEWVAGQEVRAADFSDAAAAERITQRARTAVDRMRAGVAMLRAPQQQTLRTAFALAMAAMRLQMRQATVNRGEPPREPQWRPFQLGFLLVSLASTVDATHVDRELVDLIWFPTGGGKTEAYLGLAAIEIFRRRLAYGAKGGGTAVITRYTLRLLAAQQFQRAAALVCAMELLRTSDARAREMLRFTIGLWIGNEATPPTLVEAKNSLERLHKAARPDEANEFQMDSCPWCLARLVPEKKEDDWGRYGFRLDGNDVVIHCTNANCEFASSLPLAVVDEVLYADPPTILLATVDKFARLQFKPEAGILLGLGTNFPQPSMIIQDELHLLSGPLGTTVAVFDAILQLLLRRNGSAPKIVASTATIRASDEQVRSLYGHKVALYPPAGLDDDATFFSRPVASGNGRLYVGLMPQSLSQASALVASAAPLIELPDLLATGSGTAPRDAFWTLVMYHNSLRELGRTGTLVVDDVNGRLETRADRLGLPLRRVRADRVLELTSRRGPEELPNDLRELSISVEASEQAVDVVLSSNMLSVGIDVPRLALMLMVGQPKTTSEYIQATSRVGRGIYDGIIVTLFRSNRARDRSHFETFRGYHEALYRSVEPTSVTPWSLASRDRSLAGALVALLRLSLPNLAADNSAEQLDLTDERMRAAIERLVDRLLESVLRSEPDEFHETKDDVARLVREWGLRAKQARDEGEILRYDRRNLDDDALLKRFGQPGEGWLVADSMRSVEPNVSVEVQEPLQEVERAEDPT